MGAHDTEDVVVALTQLLEEARREAAFSVIPMDHKLGYPTDLFTLIIPATGKYIASEDAIDSYTDVGTSGASGQILGSKSARADLYTTACEGCKQYPTDSTSTKEYLDCNENARG